jgi:hypothetical protein
MLFDNLGLGVWVYPNGFLICHMFAISVNNFESEESSTDQGINSQKLMQVHYHNVNCYNL